MDLDSLFKRAFDGFGDDLGSAEFPGFPGSEKASGNGQPIGDIDISRSSRISRSGNSGTGSDQHLEAGKICGEDRAREYPSKTPGNPGNPGKEAKSLAEPATSLFPEREKVPGNDREKQPSASAILPITPADVRAGVARELRHLADLGVTGPEAQRRAVAITAAKIGNAPALAESQVNTGRCHVCGEPLRDDAATVAVLNPGGAPLHMHTDGCHDAYGARRRALVERIMASAGYSTEEIRKCA